MTDRLRLIRTLVVPTARRTSWGTVAGCVIAAVALTWLVTTRDTATTGHAVSVLRWAAVLLTAGIASVLDDPTEDDLAGAGLPVWHRRLVALVVVTVPMSAGWALLLMIADLPLPWAAMSLEAAALASLGVAVASIGRVRAASVPAGVVAVAPPTVLLIAATLLPARWALLVAPGDPVWDAAHDRWALLAVGAAVAVGVTARDPARRTAWRTVRPARPRTSSTVPATAHTDTLVEPS